MASERIRAGARFVHRRQLAHDDGGPHDRRYATCVITTVRRGTVYFRAEPDGQLCKAPIEPADPSQLSRYRGFEVEEVREWNEESK